MFPSIKTISTNIIEQCQHHQVIPLNDDAHTLTIAAENISLKRDTQLGFAVNRQINTIIWPTTKFQQALHQFSSAHQYNTTKGDKNVLTSKEQSVTGLIDQTLLSAIKQHASDIHFEPYLHEYRIRFRVDGVLHIMMKPCLTLCSQITARLKVMAKLDIAQRRLPQDGQLIFNHDNQQFIMRMSTLPTSYGEKIVLRVMQQSDQNIDIEQLGFSPSELAIYNTALKLPQGLILVCGPTGSGKTVTLYSALHKLNQTQRNICSVEDPIEIPITGINQTQIHTKSGITFAQILRAFLRQDPDVIMVGEIRDKETAEIAMQAAHTGHLVLSTLHTNSSCEAVLRLNQMGIANYLIASGLKLVISQRLVRLLCPHCKKKASTPLRLPFQSGYQEVTHFQASSCQHCVGGYYGRTGIYELLNMTTALQQILLSCSLVSIESLNHEARLQTSGSLFQSGLNLIKQGLTSYAELNRVIGDVSYADINRDNHKIIHEDRHNET